MLLRITSVPLLLLAVTLVAHAQQCPDLYKRYTSEHTSCKPPNQSCTILKRGVTTKDKELILKLHNDYRSRVATGKETSGGGLPTAANMLEMVWDDELAAVAQKLAETCNFNHDCYNCRRVQAFESVGQNIGKTFGLRNAPESADWQGFIKRLYDEVSRFNKNYIKSYVFGPPSADKQYGHFTQMVWATSWKVGCGWTVYKERGSLASLTVCNYGPAGNVDGGEMYKTGATCSACPKNSCCGDSCQKRGVTAGYTGLCKVVDTSTPPEGPGPHDNDDYLFYCDFNDQPDCAMSVEGKAWTVVKTSGGNWLSVVLKGGEKTKLTFDKSFDTKGRFCMKVVIRTAPNVDGQAEGLKGDIYLDTGRPKPSGIGLNFIGVSKENRQNFRPKVYFPNAGVSKIKYIFEFAVPAGVPPQFVEIKEVLAKYGRCR